MRSAQRTARAGPSKVAKNPSPAVFTSRPRNAANSLRTIAWCRSSNPHHAWSPTREVLGRPHNVREQHSRKHAIHVAYRAYARQERLHLVEYGILVAYPWQVVVAGQLDEARTGNACGHPASFREVHVTVVRAVYDQCRHGDSGEHGTDVDLRVHPKQRDRSAWACRATKVGGQAPDELAVMHLARGQVRKVHEFPPFALDLRVLQLPRFGRGRPRVIGTPD